MNCLNPKCNYEGISDADHFCARCGQPLEVAARVDIRQNVTHNLGRIIGVQTAAIHGNVYGGDIYQVQVYALGDTGRAENWTNFLTNKTRPYKYLYPYTARDRVIFKGRQADIEQVIHQLGEQRLLVVHGQVGVGKTSLLAAGVIPTLMEYGALVVHTHEYTQPLEKIILQALAASADRIHIPVSDDLKLPALLRTVCETMQGTLVLVLDQFEGLFAPAIDNDQRAATIESLAQTLQVVEPELLRLVLVIRSGDLAQLRKLQDHLPNLWHRPFSLLSFCPQQAQTAIEAPLEALNYPGGVSYDEGLVCHRIIPDLDALSPEEPERIMPTHLQIVCHNLYQEACGSSSHRPPRIDETLYRRLKGAEGIMAAYVDKTLETELGAQQTLARHVIEAMASPNIEHWISPDQIPTNGFLPNQLRDVLDHLVDAELLVYQGVNSRRVYAFASPCVQTEVRLHAPAEVRRRFAAGDDLERVWSAWLAHESLASRTQLRHLEEARVDLKPAPIKLLLLLRSAVALNILSQPWSADLGMTAEGVALINQLEKPKAPDQVWNSSSSDLERARHLLDITPNRLSDWLQQDNISFGPVARLAVSHPGPILRRTAALALTALDSNPKEGIKRLDRALTTEANSWRRWWRRVELRSVLIDADPRNELLRDGLSSLDRVGVWGWRASRRIIHHRHRIAGLLVGGGIGAGLSLGLLRAGLGGLAGRMVGIQFAMYFWWAWLLGAALALGMALAEPLLLGAPKEESINQSVWRTPLHPDQLAAMLAAVLGTLFFGLAHIIVAWFNGLSLTEAPLVVPMGFVAGLGLSLALYNQPQAGWRQNAGYWLLRLGIAALTYLSIQAIFILIRNQGAGIAIAWGSSFYEANFSRFNTTWWQDLIRSCPQCFDYLALVDAALVGIALAVGMTAGLVGATAWLAWWRNLVNQVDD